MNKIILFLFSVFCFLSTSCYAADFIQQNEKGEYSAQLNNVRLSELATFIAKEYGVAIKGEEALMETPVTVSFKNVGIEKMLKKILTRMNYVFTYDQNQKVIAVTLLKTGDVQTEVASSGATPPPAPSDEIANIAPKADLPVGGNVFPPTAGSNPGVLPDSSEANREDPITSFKIVENAPPPGSEKQDGNSGASDPITSFKIVPNAAPPGGN